MALIKCPECSHEVSDQAPHCPFCGVEIANNITTCPDCGKVVLSKQRNCPNCGCVITTQVPQGNARRNKNTSSHSNYPNTENHPKSHATLWVVLTIFILLALAGGGFIFYQQYTAKLQMENAYAALEGNNSVEDYEAFISQFPESPYLSQVKNRMTLLKNIENKWVEISMSPSKNDFELFLKQFPKSRFENACIQKIDSIDWIDASTENSAISYQRYIDEHPNGKYIAEAKIGKENIDKLTVSYVEKDGVRNVITRYYEAVTANDAENLNSTVIERMYQQTMSFMQKLHSENSHVSFSINSPINVSKAPNPNTDFVFIAKYNVTRTTVSTSGESNSIVFNAVSSVTPDMRIISLRTTRVEE